MPGSYFIKKDTPVKVKRFDKIGREVEIRLIRPDDTTRLRAFYEGLSDVTIHSFFRGSPEIEVFAHKEKVLIECHSDPESRLITVAVYYNEIIGICMVVLCSLPDHEYEIGNIVSDENQGLGIASLLMEEVISYATKHWLTGTIIAETTLWNYKANRLLKKFNFVEKESDRGEITWAYKVH